MALDHSWHFSYGIGQVIPKKRRRTASRWGGFGMRYPVTNRQFGEFVKASEHITVAEITPDPKDYPGMLPHMIYAGSLMFSPPALVDGTVYLLSLGGAAFESSVGCGRLVGIFLQSIEYTK
jgi:hypothetical protein